MAGFVELRSYAAEFDAEGVRLSKADSHGAEYWALIEGGYGPQYVERRKKAAAAIEQAIALQRPAGRVGIFVSSRLLEVLKRLQPELFGPNRERVDEGKKQAEVGGEKGAEGRQARG